VYGREVSGRVLSFGHAGILYEKSFVMYDRQTDSLWVHVTGRAKEGPLAGTQLPFIPSTVTTWSQWKAAHPRTLVLPGRRRGGFMGTYQALTAPAELGLAVVVAFQAKLYPFPALATTPVVNDRFNGLPLVVHFAREEGTAVAWGRRVGQRDLTFELGRRHGVAGPRLLRDRETGSAWSWLRGEAVSGPLRGTVLPAVSSNPILIERFATFYPDGPVFKP
jgi:hypothetical protein